MDIKPDYSKNLILVNTSAGVTEVNLDQLREHILRYWHPLAKKFHVGIVYKDGQPVHTFDWAKIFGVVMDGAIILEDFMKMNNLFPKPGLVTKKPLSQMSLPFPEPEQTQPDED